MYNGKQLPSILPLYISKLNSSIMFCHVEKITLQGIVQPFFRFNNQYLLTFSNHKKQLIQGEKCGCFYYLSSSPKFVKPSLKTDIAKKSPHVEGKELTGKPPLPLLFSGFKLDTNIVVEINKIIN